MRYRAWATFVVAFFFGCSGSDSERSTATTTEAAVSLAGGPIAAGEQFTCALVHNGAVKCWGENASGQLGLGNTDNRGAPFGAMGDALGFVQLGTGRTATQITAGEDHACALLDNGQVKCWGENANGQLGIGSTARRGDNAGEMGDLLPAVDLGSGRTAKAVAAGYTHTCAILDTNQVKCWGANSNGALGVGDTTDRLAPAAVNLGSRTAIAIGAGLGFTCALLDNNQVTCWGTNGAGELGNGLTGSRGVLPSQMGGGLKEVLLGAGTVKSLSVGGRHACVIMVSGGADKIKCWGRNLRGQLGYGDVTDRGLDPTKMGNSLDFLVLGSFGSSAPPNVLSQVSAGREATCARSGPAVKCWGKGENGGLGSGESLNLGDGAGEMGSALPLVPLGTGLPAVSVARSSGNDGGHVCVTLQASGGVGITGIGVKCFGRDAQGTLGLGPGQSGNRGDQTGEMGDNLAFVDLGCADPNLCNGTETYSPSLRVACLSGTPLPVNDNNVCTNDYCDPSTGVHNDPITSQYCYDGQCLPHCGGKTCGASDGCGGICACVSGQTDCDQFGECAGQMVCLDLSHLEHGTHCVDAVCLVDPASVDCGSPDSPCQDCHGGVACESVADCYAGLEGFDDDEMYCMAGGGWRYGLPAETKVCAPERCLDGTGECGNIYSPCGLCECSSSCEGKACGADDGCGNECGCESGETACSEDGTCAGDLECFNGTCVDPGCSTNPSLVGCGYEGAACGMDCTPQPTCATDGDCPDDFVCPETSNGWRYGVPGEKVCEPASGCDGASDEVDCGTATSPCGVCSCTPDCSDKQCGDVDLSDGCGGHCDALCEDRAPDCRTNDDCQAGSVCMVAAGARVGLDSSLSVCLPELCDLPGLTAPDCGTLGSLCGLCPPNQLECAERECGNDPETGVSCGSSCPSGTFCNGAGRCAELEQTPQITVTDGGGSPRTVLPAHAPNAPGFGATPGRFAVTDRGSAEYTIPISVPPGRAGVEPALSIRYNSSSGAGALGVGWSLEGLSAIERCSKFYAIDGFTAPPKGEPSDAFCLDGQRLVLGSDGSYYTNVDTFTKVVKEPSFFTAYAKGGLIFDYGAGATAKVTMPSQFGDVTRTWAVSRVRDRVGNTMRITYRGAPAELLPSAITYTGFATSEGDREVRFLYEDTGGLQLGARVGGGPLLRSQVLSRIEVRAQDELVRRYELTYGVLPNGQRLLKKIQECASPTGICKAPTEFSYYQESGFEDPINIDPEQPDNGFALAIPSGFVLRNTHLHQDVLSTPSANTSQVLVTPFPAGSDMALSVLPVIGPVTSTYISLVNAFGADVRTKAFYYSRTWDYTNNELSGTHFMCGDGKTRPNLHVIGDTKYDDQTLHQVCPTWGNVPAYWDYSSGRAHHTASARYRPREWFLDIDGDGVQDKLWCSEDGEFLRLSRSQADQTASPEVPIDGGSHTSIQAFGAMCQFECPSSDYVCAPDDPFSMVFDVDGDGTTNLVVRDKKEGWAGLTFANGVMSWHPEWFAELAIDPASQYIVPLDANGDGLRDILALPSTEHGAANEAPAKLWVNSGTGFRSLTLSGEAVFHRAPKFPAFAMDVDGDGSEELVMPDGSYAGPEVPWNVRYFRVGPARIWQERLFNVHATPGIFGDFNGDGNLDLLSQGDTEYEFKLRRGKGRRRNLLQDVVDGLGRRIDVEYEKKNRLDQTVYERSFSACDWPTSCLDEVGHPLVSFHKESHYEEEEREGEERTPLTDLQYSYTYTGANGDRGGYGWLGFYKRTITVQDRLSQVVRKQSFEYEAPLSGWEPSTMSLPYTQARAGLVKRIEEEGPVATSSLTKSDAPDKFVTITNLDWQVRISANGRPFPQLNGRTVRVMSAGTLHLTTEDFDVDTYGNQTSYESLTQDFAGVPDGPVSGSGSTLSVITDYQHTPDEVAAWLIALPESVEVRATPRCANTAECVAKTKRRRSEIRYYPNGQVHFIDREVGKTDLELTTEYRYDGRGNVNLIESTDANDTTRRTAIDFDTRRLFPTTITRNSQQTTQVRFDDRFGLVTAFADPNGIDSTFSYDQFGAERVRRTPTEEVETDYGSTMATTVGPISLPAGYQVTTTVAGGGVSREEFNALGQPIRTVSSGFDGEQVFQEFGYDERQRLVTAYRPHVEQDLSQGTVEYEYDELDRIVREIHPSGAEVQRSYASARTLMYELEDFLVPGATGVTRVITPPANDEGPERTFFLLTDRDGKAVKVVDALGEVTEYEYGAFDALERITDPAGRSIAMTYDAYGRKLTVTDLARGGAEESRFNAYGELIYTKDHADRESQTSYDVFGRPTHMLDSDGVTQWIYDGDGPNEIGRLVETVSPTGQRTLYGYQAPEPSRNRGLLNRVTQEIIAPGESATDVVELETAFDFDDFSRLERIWYPHASGHSLPIDYEFDSSGNVKRAHDITRTYWELIEADQGYRIKEERFGSASCGGVGQGERTHREYDDLTGAIKTIRTTCGSEVLQDLAYDYDLSGNLNYRHDARSSLTEEVFYDELNRPIAKQVPGFGWQDTHAYDSATGRLTYAIGVGSYTYEAEGRDWLATAGTVTYGHDAVGNVTSRSGTGVAGGSQTIEYTAFDLPRSITTGSAPTDTVTRLAYGADGSRVARKTATATTFYADSLYERTVTPDAGEGGTSTVHRFFVYAGGRAVAQLESEQSGGSVSVSTVRGYFHDDALGSIHTITDGDEVEATRDYALFGGQRNASSDALENEFPLGFTGHEGDSDLGLINMKGRIYDPHAGQFLSADPVLAVPFGQGLNRYAYVNNSPLNYTDPSGFMADDAKLAIGGVIGLAGYGGLIAATSNLSPAIPTTISGGAAYGSSATQFSGTIGITGNAGVASGVSPATGLATAGLGNVLVMGSTFVTGAMLPQGPTPTGTKAVAPKGARAVSSRGGTPGAGGVNQAIATSPTAEPPKAPASGSEWGPGPDLSGTAGPYGAAPAVPNAILSDPQFQVRDTSEKWKAHMEAVMMLSPLGPEEAVGALLGRGVKLLAAAAKIQKHHIFPQAFRKFFSSKGVNIDQFTVAISATTHLKGVHGRGLGNMPGGWNARWEEFIKMNPNATAREIYQFGGKLMDEFGLSHLPIVPY